MSQKTPIRLKFSELKSPPVKAPPPVPALVGSERLTVKCGHEIVFDHYAKDSHRDARRLKALSRDCALCRKARVSAEAAVAVERKRKKEAARSQQLKSRLPDGAVFNAVYDAVAMQWTGSLTIEGVVYERTAGAIKKLLFKLDDAYRDATKPSTPEPVTS